MEPGHEDREDRRHALPVARPVQAAMEPGHEDREDDDCWWADLDFIKAAMKPGHEDREDLTPGCPATSPKIQPQWSPVMKTGKTSGFTSDAYRVQRPQWSPVMKTGKTTQVTTSCTSCKSRNGARS